MLIGLLLWHLFDVSQEENTNTSVWCNVKTKTLSSGLRVLLFGDGIQTLFASLSFHLTSQCRSKWLGLLPNPAGQTYWSSHTISVCHGGTIRFLLGLESTKSCFSKCLNCFIIISFGQDRKGCSVYNMLLSSVQCTIWMIINEVPILSWCRPLFRSAWQCNQCCFHAL